MPLEPHRHHKSTDLRARRTCFSSTYRNKIPPTIHPAIQPLPTASSRRTCEDTIGTQRVLRKDRQQKVRHCDVEGIGGRTRTFARKRFQHTSHRTDYVKAHVELAACYNNWAQLHLDNRDPDRAKTCFEEAISLLTAAQSRFPMQPEIPRFLQIIQKTINILNDEEMNARIDDGKSKTMFVFEGEDSRYRQ